jgi:hypothetical protein
MHALLDLQTNFRDAILGLGEAPISSAILGDSLDPSARLSIYRNHVFASLTASLKAMYPVVCRLVDERFFAYAAHEYIRAQPPGEPCLVRYGEAFPDFLGSFPPCRSLPYLKDVAALEWAIVRVKTALSPSPLSARSLAIVPAAAAGSVRFTFAGTIVQIESDWPIDRIWIANQPGADPDATVDLDAGGVRFEIRRRDRDVVFQSPSAPLYAFRSALLAGQRLDAATQAALALDPFFDLAVALRHLLNDGIVTGLKFPYPPQEKAP